MTGRRLQATQLTPPEGAPTHPRIGESPRQASWAGSKPGRGEVPSRLNPTRARPAQEDRFGAGKAVAGWGRPGERSPCWPLREEQWRPHAGARGPAGEMCPPPTPGPQSVPLGSQPGLPPPPQLLPSRGSHSLLCDRRPPAKVPVLCAYTHTHVHTRSPQTPAPVPQGCILTPASPDEIWWQGRFHSGVVAHRADPEAALDGPEQFRGRGEERLREVGQGEAPQPWALQAQMPSRPRAERRAPL